MFYSINSNICSINSLSLRRRGTLCWPPNLFLDYFHAYDQREQLITFALTGSMGEKKAYDLDDPFLNGKYASTLWILLKEGQIKETQGFEILHNNPNIIEVITRLKIGDIITKDIIGTEKQVYCRIYIAASSKIPFL